MNTNRICAGLLALGVWTSQAQGDVVTDWNEKLVEIMVAEKTNALMQSRNAAIMHVAMFEAVNSIERRASAYSKAFDAAKGASADAAAAAAAHRSLAALYPNQANALNEAYSRSLATIAEGPSKRDGIAVGEKAARTIIALRADDGHDKNSRYTPGTGPGAWVPNPGIAPLGVDWGRMRPWVLKNGSQFRPGPPPSLSSDEFKRDYLEVMEIGGKASAKRTAEQTQVANLCIAPGVPVWSPVARQLSAARDLTLAENARLFALLMVSAADALVACYETKYVYNNFRPVTAIRNGTGRSDLPTDSTWEPAIATPPFPAYVSGHACFAGAAQVVLESFFGDGETSPVRLTSPTAPGFVRKHTRLSSIVEEVSNARIWGGIHWRTDQTVGEELGRKVGRYAVENYMKPLRIAGQRE